MILSLFMSGMYTYTNKVIQWQTEKKEQQGLIAGKGRSNLNTRMQLDKGTYILTGQILKPEFSGKLEEDAEAHLLQSNDWMEAHHFNEDIRVQRFCLTLLGEARLWYHSLEPLGNTTWAQLQNLFRQRYFKIRQHS